MAAPATAGPANAGAASASAGRRPPKKRKQTSSLRLLTEVPSPKMRMRSNTAVSRAMTDAEAGLLVVPPEMRLMKGWMTKQGGKWKSWKKRWFVLTSHELVYFEKEDERVVKGRVLVDEMTFAERNFTEKTNCIAVGTVGRTFLMATENAVDFDEWLAWLTAVIFVPPIPRDAMESFQLWREALEQNHRPTMARMLEPGREIAAFQFDAMHDVGVPALEEMQLPPLATASDGVDLVTITIRDSRYAVAGTILMVRSPDGGYRLRCENWGPSIETHLTMYAGYLAAARNLVGGGGVAAVAQEDNQDDEESSG